MTYLTAKDVVIQWVFLNKVHEVSNKYTVECLAPVDSETGMEIVRICNEEWQTVAAGSTTPQSMGYAIINGNDTTKITEDAMPFIDQTKQYVIFKGTQNADTKIPIKVYDSVTTEITDNSLIGSVGAGSRCNVQLGITGYDKPQKGVKNYCYWVQVVHFELNKYTAQGPAAVEGGFTAPPQMAAPVIQENVQVPVQQAPVQAAPAQQAPVMQAPAQQAAPVQQAPVMQAPAQMAAPQAPGAPAMQAPVQQAAPAMQAPTQMAAPQAPGTPQAPVAPQAPTMPQ